MRTLEENPVTVDVQTQPADTERAPFGRPVAVALRDIKQRVLWLATSIVHAANARRPNDSGVMVGRHQGRARRWSAS